MAIQTVLNTGTAPLVINTAGNVLPGRSPYLYDDATITPADFAYIQRYLSTGRLQLITSGITIPSPSAGAALISVTISGANLVFTDSLGGTSTVALPTGGGAPGSVDLSDYVRSADLSTALAAKVNSSTYTAGLAAKADASALAAKANAADVYDKTTVDTKTAALAFGGVVVKVRETASGYVYSNGSLVTTRIPGISYHWVGLGNPPFPILGEDWDKEQTIPVGPLIADYFTTGQSATINGRTLSDGSDKTRTWTVASPSTSGTPNFNVVAAGGAVAGTLANDLIRATVDTGRTTYRYRSTLVALNADPTKQRNLFVASLVDATNYWRAYTHTDGKWKIGKTLAGTTTAYTSSADVTAAAGDIVEWLVTTNAVTLRVNGTVISTVPQDAALVNATRVGFITQTGTGSGATPATVDNAARFGPLEVFAS